MTPEELLSCKEIAAALRRPVSYVYAMRRAGFPMPGRRAYLSAALAWLEALEQRGGTPRGRRIDPPPPPPPPVPGPRPGPPTPRSHPGPRPQGPARSPGPPSRPSVPPRPGSAAGLIRQFPGLRAF